MTDTLDCDQVIDRETPFELNAIFFSRTDKRGVIEAANNTFQQISGYDWDQLVGAPHKLVRHPDMPRAAFWLVWTSIANNQPIGAYVKNRSRDGAYYWVFAVMVPGTDGYLSVRIKPSSEIFHQIKDIYAAVRSREATEDPTPEASAAYLTSELSKLGYKSYEDFIAWALAEELTVRDATLARASDGSMSKFQSMVRAMTSIQKAAANMAEVFGAIRTLPANMRIAASRVEPSGGPITAMSANYAEQSERLALFVDDFLMNGEGSFQRTRSSINEATFLQGTTAILQEVAQSMELAGDCGPADKSAERKALKDHAISCAGKANLALVNVNSNTVELARSMLLLKRYVTALASTRILCRVESARLLSKDGGLDQMVDVLDQFQIKIEDLMEEINDLNRMVQDNATGLKTVLH